MSLFRLLAIVWTLGIISNTQAEVTLNQIEAISAFSKQRFPASLFNGLLCWTNDKMMQLFLSISQQGLFYKNGNNFDGTIQSVLLLDQQCNYPYLMDKQKILQNIIFLNIASCAHLPDWNYQFPQANIHIFKDNVFITCHKSKMTAPWQSSPVAKWENELKSLVDIATYAEKSIEEQTIDVTFVASPATAKNIKDFRRNLHIEPASRFNYQLFTEIFTYLNLTPVISFIPALNLLKNKSSDPPTIIAFPQSISKDNLTSYDFLTSSTPNRNTFLMRAPSLSAVSNVFTLPLELNVWYASYILIAVLFITVFVIVKVEWKFPDMVPNKYRILYPRVMDVVQMHVGAIAQQGSEAEPTSGGGKIATFLIFLFFLFLYTSYSANIVALLGSTTTRVHGVRDLKDFNVKLGIDKDDFTKDMFRNQKSLEHRALFNEKLVKDDCYMTMDKGLVRIRNEFFAFHGDSDRIYKLIEKSFIDNEKCGFVEIPYLSEPDLLIPIRKGSVLRETLRIGLALFLERGMHNRIKNIIFAKQPRCYSGGTNFVSVSLLDCYFAFVIYCGGTATACLIFLMELLVSHSKLKHLLKFGFHLRKVVELQEEEEEQRVSTNTIN